MHIPGSWYFWTKNLVVRSDSAKVRLGLRTTDAGDEQPQRVGFRSSRFRPGILPELPYGSCGRVWRSHLDHGAGRNRRTAFAATVSAQRRSDQTALSLSKPCSK